MRIGMVRGGQGYIIRSGPVRVADLKNLRGPDSLRGALDLYQTTVILEALIRQLGELARSAKDIRVRYASELLLRKESQMFSTQDEAARRLLLAMLPKTDLHVHIDGSVRIETVMDLAEKQGVNLAAVLEKAKQDSIKGPFLQDVPSLPPDPTMDQIRALSQIRGVQPDFLKLLFLGFDFAVSVMQTREGLRRTAYELVADSYREGVMHLTAIFAPCLHGGAGLSYDERVEAAIAGLEEGKREFGVSWELALGIYRGVYVRMYPAHPQEAAELAIRWARKYPQQIAIDVVGAEFEMPLSAFEEEFEALKGQGVILRVHAGESPGQGFNIKTALDWGLKRIGHGSHFGELEEDQRRRLFDSGITFEVSPISNLKAHCISGGRENQLKNHPLQALFEKGARITLCTDDRSVMLTDNVSQMLEVEQALGWRFIERERVLPRFLFLAGNGFQTIADLTVGRKHEHDSENYIREINRLMGILAA